MSLGEIIKEKRRQLGLTQLDLAEKLNISILKVATFEADEEEPSDELYILLSKALECDVAELTDKVIVKEEPQGDIIEKKELEKIEEKKEDIQKEEPQIDIVEEKEQLEFEKIEEDVHKDEPKTVCSKCGKKYFLNQIEEIQFKYYEMHTVFICESCSKIINEEVNRELKKRIENDIYQRRKRAFSSQAFILLVTLAIAVPFIFINYLIAVIIGGIGLLISTLVATIIFDNLYLIHSYRELAFAANNPESSCELLTFIVFILSLLLIIVSIFLYPFAVYNSFKNQSVDFAAVKMRYGHEIRTRIYYSLIKKKDEYRR